MTIQLEPMCSENLSRDPVSPAWISGLLYRNWKNTFKKKNHNSKKRETLTLAASKNELCVCKTTKQKREKKQKKEKKKKRKNFLFLVRTKEGYLTDFFHL